MPRSSIRLNDRQVAVLEWIKAGCPPGVYEADGYSHRVTARALQNRGLVEIRGRGPKWVASVTPRGVLWPNSSDEDRGVTHGEHAGTSPPARRRRGGVGESGVAGGPADASVRAARSVERRAAQRKRTTPPVRVVERREMFTRYRVMVTRVQVAERWVRATDEEDAAMKVQAEFDRPYGYFGNWTTTTSEVEVVEAEQATVVSPNPLSKDGPLLLGLKDAAKALGISYSMLYELTNKGDIEWTQIGTRKYVSRDSLHAFITANTHRGYHSRY